MTDMMLAAARLLSDSPIASVFDAALRASFLILAASFSTLLLRRRSAAHRHMVWSIAVALTLALPLLSRLTPPVEIPVPFNALRTPRTVADPGPAEMVPVAGPPVLREATADPVLEIGTRTGTGISKEGAEEGSVGTGAPSLPRKEAPLMAAERPILREAGHVSLPLPSLLLGVWVVGVLSVLGSLVQSIARLRWRTERSARIVQGPLWEAAQDASARLDLPHPPVLLRGEVGTVPMTWGVRRPVVLLPLNAEGWEPWRLDAVFLHELGHYRRRDYLSQIIAHFACAFYWFNPLVWFAAHRMWIEREHACDDLVISSGLDAPTYATDLLSLARALRSDPPTGAMAFAVSRPGRLKDRLLAILDEKRNRLPMTRQKIVGTVSIALAVAFGLAALTPAEAMEEEGKLEERTPEVSTLETTIPTPASTTSDPGMAIPQAVRQTLLCGPADGEAHKRANLINNETRWIEAEYGDCRSSVRIEGDIRFIEDFTRVARMSSDARMTLEVTRPGGDRRLDIRPGPGGRPEYNWSENGRAGEFGSSEESWFESALLELFRSSDFMAKERAEWILSREGVEGIFSEVELMTADHAKAAYLMVPIEGGKLSPAQVRSTLDVAGRIIDSDHSLGRVLQATAANYDFDAATRSAFLQAATSIDSDHTQGQIFLAALSRGDLSSENLDIILRTASESIESDHTLGQILMELAARYPLEPRLRGPFLRAAETIGSDHTAGQVYEIVLEQEGLTDEELGEVLDAASRIDSDHTRGQVLMAAAKLDLSRPGLRRAFLENATTIGSDHTQGQVFRAALDLGGLEDNEMATIIEAVGEISSDHEVSTLLTEIAGRGISNPVLQEAYLRAAGSIESDFSLAQALGAFARMGTVGPDQQVHLLRTAETIESDHSLATLLVEFARNYPVTGEVRDAFLDTMGTIQSKNSRAQVEAAIM